MDVAHVVLDYLKVLAWPSIVLVVAVLFRSEFRAVLKRLTGGEVDALGVKVRLELDRARREVERAESEDATGEVAARPDLSSEVQAILDRSRFAYAKGGPIDAVSAAFIGLLQATVDVAREAGLEPSGPSTGALWNDLMLEMRRRGVITMDEIEAADRLSKIYSARSRDETGPWKDESFASLYADTAWDLSRVIVTKVLDWRDGQSDGQAVHEPIVRRRPAREA